MFLILGIENCNYCQLAKKLLENNSLKFKYFDLNKYLYDWKEIFSLLSLKQRSVPIIYKIKKECEPNMDMDLDLDLRNKLEDWNLVGDYFQLEELLEEEEINIDDNY